MPNIIMADPKGERLHFNGETGAYYPIVLDVKIAGGRGSGQNIMNHVLERRWECCTELKEATIDSPLISISTKGARHFSGCTKLEKLTYLGGIGAAAGAVLAEECPMLETVVMGSIGYPCDNTLSDALFKNSGGSAVGAKTITVYIADEASIPFANAPFGLTGAAVSYRSSTTGEVRTE